jgi:hypothetical protein
VIDFPSLQRKIVCASSNKRTRFQVLAKDNRLLDKVIIFSDQIVIALARDSNAFVSLDTDNTGLIISPHPQDFSFSDLNGNFLAEGPTDATPVLYVPTGENWALVE